MKAKTSFALLASLLAASLWTACSPADPATVADPDAAADAVAPPPTTPTTPPPPPPDARPDAPTPIDAAPDAPADAGGDDAAADASPTDAAPADAATDAADAAILGCPAGSYVVGAACAPCARGTYSSAPNSPSCTACADDFSTPAAMSTSAAACTPCAADEYSNASTDHLCVGATTAFTTAGLTDFDVNGAHLVYRAGAFIHCTLPACADPTTLPAPAPTSAAAWLAGDDDRLYFIQGGGLLPLDLGSRNYDGTAGPLANLGTSSASYSQNLTSFHRGRSPLALVREVPKPLGGGRFQYIWGGRASNTSRTAQATGMAHSNGAAVASYLPARQIVPPPGAGLPSSFSVTGHPNGAVKPATDPTIVAVSTPGGADPMVFVVRGGRLEACPLATPCAAWSNLGAAPSLFNVDATHLYVGTATGLQRCALAEISAASTCTLTAAGPAEPVSAPLYLTLTEAWYRSGDAIRRVPK
ncbi:MAG TPA: hypothetical protein PLR99_11285 [Polyangiaceae bacterium]|nr:hypothetical protein [Polyangiaceae bacterium]